MAKAAIDKRGDDSMARRALIVTGASVAVGLIAALITWRYPNPIAHIALVLSFTTALLGICLDLRVSAYGLGKKLDAISTMAALDQQITEKFKDDPFMQGRYRSLKEELQLMSEGGYTIHALGEVYADDIRQIGRLRATEVLRSSCPMANDKLEGVLDQIKDPNYQRSMKEHAKASQRGVDVRRLYLFRSISMCPPKMLAHLKEVTGPNHQVRVVFRDRLLADAGIDFLVFGAHTVSMGVLDIDTGLCKATRVSQDRDAVQSAISRFDDVWAQAHDLAYVEKAINDQRKRNAPRRVRATQA